jgi:RNA polymerase sigma factor (sigma-70 family)
MGQLTDRDLVRLTRSAARKKFPRDNGRFVEDATQAALLRTLKRVNQYNPELAQPSTYVMGPTYQFMGKFYEYQRIIPLPEWVITIKNRAKRESQKFLALHGRYPTWDELGIPPEHVKAITALDAMSLDKKISGTDDAYLIDIVADVSSVSSESALFVEQCLAVLTPIERDTFVRTKLQGETIQSIADEEKVSHAKIRVRINRAIRKLRKFLSDAPIS